ncbi:MAG: autotransporter-associated beta strand repeat-containing protein [Pirellulales bacterium]
MLSYVQITGDGTGATGYAVVDTDPSSATYGQVTSVVITNPGVNYTTASVTLVGGGGTGASVTTTLGDNTSGGLTKVGLGTLTLSGASTFTGPLTISGGSVASATFNNIGVAGPLGAGIATNAATNAASLVLDGGILSYTGTTAVTDRLITLTGAGGQIDSVNTTAANTIEFSGTGAVAYSGTGARTLTFGGTNTGTNVFNPQINDAGSDAVTLGKTGAGTWSLTNTNSFTGGVNLGGGVLIFGSGSLGTSGAVTFNSSSTLRWNNHSDDLSARLVLNGAVTGTIDTNGNNVVFASSVGATGSAAGILAKVGAGSLTLNAAALHTGGTTLSAGTLNIGHAGALGSGTFTIAASTTFNNTSGAALTLSTNGPQAWNGDFTFTGTNNLDMGTGAVTLSAARAVNIAANTLTVGGVVGGAFALTKNGAGTLYLRGDNTFGVTAGSVVTINAGVLKIDSEAGLGNVLNDVTFANGATLQITNGFSANAGKIFSFTAAGGGTIQVDSGTFTINSALTGVAGTGGLIKTGAGTLALAAASTAYDAVGVGAGGVANVGFRVDAGTLLLTGNSNGVVGDNNPATMTIQLNGGNLAIQSDTTSIARANLYLSAAAVLTIDNGAPGLGIVQAIGASTGPQLTVGVGASTLQIVGGSNITGGTAVAQFTTASYLAAPTFDIVNPTSGTMRLTIGAITGGTFTTTLTGNGSFTQTGVLTSTGGFTLGSTFSGLAVLSQANAYSGANTLNGGVLEFTAANNLGDASATNTLVFGGGTLRYAGSTALDVGATRTVTINAGGATFDVPQSSGVLTISSGISAGGSGNLTKTGTGTLVVPGSTNLNSGAGVLNVSAGTYRGGFGTAGVGKILVGATGVLDFTNGAAQTLTLNPVTGALTLSSGARLAFELDGTSNDGLIVPTGGTLTLASLGSFTFDFYNLVRASRATSTRCSPAPPARASTITRISSATGAGRLQLLHPVDRHDRAAASHGLFAAVLEGLGQRFVEYDQRRLRLQLVDLGLRRGRLGDRPAGFAHGHLQRGQRRRPHDHHDARRQLHRRRPAIHLVADRRDRRDDQPRHDRHAHFGSRQHDGRHLRRA